MKKLNLLILTIGNLLFLTIANAQVGIGTSMPDSSAILDLNSTDGGLLLPRMTTIQRDLINNPATGLMIYNLSASNVQVNTGTPAFPIWYVSEGTPDSSIISITLSGDISTESTTSVLVPGMTLSPPAGTYLVLFNGQYGLLASEPISTVQGVIDLNTAYMALMDITGTETHGPVLGNGETITAGVYDMAAAASLAGTLTLDGEGDPDALFIFRTGGALTTGAMTTVVLINGASANNIFWVAEGALSLAANTIMKGTLIAHNAATSAAAGSDLEGRMFSTTGAIAFGPGTAYIPDGDSYIDFGILSTFVMFTSTGAVSNTDPSMITGDVGTNGGAIAGFENLNGNVFSPGGAAPPVNNTLVTFSVFQNDELVPFSSRTKDVNTSSIALQAIATVTAGQPIDIRWFVDAGGVLIGNRILSLLRVQ